MAVTEEPCSETVNSVFKTGDVQKHMSMSDSATLPSSPCLCLTTQSRVLAQMSSVLVIHGMPFCRPVLPSSVPAVRMRRPPPPRHLSVDDQCIQTLQSEDFTITEYFHFRVESRYAARAVQGLVST